MCGIVSYCGSKPANPLYIHMMMMYNEERGGDGTGWAINNQIKKDTDKVPKFLKDNPIIVSATDTNYTIIAHARKKSSGYADKENAHPFGIYRGRTEKEMYDLILAMNGTVTNKEELAEEFNVKLPVNTFSWSDTRVIATAMAELGSKGYMKVIEGYMGTATLVFFSPKYPNQLFCYKDPLRDLFYWQAAEDQIYVSSMEEPFIVCGASKEDIHPFKDEFIYTIVSGKIIKEKKVTRNPIPIYVKWTNSNVKVKANSSSYENNDWRNALQMQNQFCSVANRTIPGSTSKTVDIEDVRRELKKEFREDLVGNKMYMGIDRYLRNGHYPTGIFLVEKDGTVARRQKIGKEYETMYIVNGFRCKNKETYEDLHHKVRVGPKDESVDIIKFKQVPLSKYVESFMYPILTQSDGKMKFVLNNEWKAKLDKDPGNLVLDAFLCPCIFKLEYTGEVVATTEKPLCDIRSYQKKITSLTHATLEDRINASYSRHAQQVKIHDLVNENNTFTSMFLYKQFHEDIKENPTDELRKFFYNLLLDVLLKDSVINATNLDEFKKDPRFIDVQVIEEIDNALKLYKKNITVSKVDDQEKPPSSKLIIKEYQDKSEICNQPGFQEDVYAATNPLGELFETWGERSKPEPFYEAVVLSIYNTIEDDKAADRILEAMGAGMPAIKELAVEYYGNWIDIVQKTGAKGFIIVGSETDISSRLAKMEELEDLKEDIEEKDEDQADVENMTPEEYEEDVRNEFSEMGTGLQEFYNRVVSTAENDEDRTPKVKLILSAVHKALLQMEEIYKQL